MFKVRKYRTLPREIEAVQVPRWAEYVALGSGFVNKYLDDCLLLADWCGGVSFMMREEDEEPGPCIEFPTAAGTAYARPGEWITKEQGAFWLLSADSFAAKYEPVY